MTADSAAPAPTPAGESEQQLRTRLLTAFPATAPAAMRTRVVEAIVEAMQENDDD